MKKSRQLAAVCLMTAAMAIANAAEIVPITAVTGSNGGDQYANGMDSLTNGSGITKANPLDPSTWTFSGSAYQDEWMAWYLKVAGVATPGLNGKLAWAAFDVGTKQSLGTLYLFNNNYQAGVSGVAQYNLYYADSPTVALPAKPAKNTYSNTGLTPQGDYDFSSGGWTLFNTAGSLTATKAGITTVDLRGVSARYLAVEILTNYGDTYQGGRAGFDEIAVTVGPPDTDGDGFPDAYELAHTDPPSATALNRDDDLEPDGLSNWQEYLIGTHPGNPDTDDDTLLDGAEVAGAGSRPPTNPLLADTDGDGLSDLVETNSGVWGGISDPGTNPANADTDGDGLRDGVETNTRIFVDLTNTGTHPLLADTDSDGAGDWYEVAIIDMNPTSPGYPPNSPNDPALKPNIPYPLPDPNPSDSGNPAKPVKVYIMSGQSNMVGFGRFVGPEAGTLQTIVKSENKFPNLVTPEGAWTSRKDVRYRGVISATGNADLAPGITANSFGPELGFGYVMGWYHDEPVLLIKASQGNRSLLWDFAAPTTPSFAYTDNYTYAGYGQAPNRWLTASGAPSPYVWYAGKQFDDCFKKESDMGLLTWQNATAYQASGNIGSQIRHNGVEYICKVSHTSSPSSEPGAGSEWATYWSVYSVTNTADVLDAMVTAGQAFEIAGFVWWQGYGDTGEPSATKYQENMARFIEQIRAYYQGRYPAQTKSNTPFVLATLATNGGWNNPDPGHLKVANAQLAVSNPSSNVKTIEARGFWRNFGPSGEGYHYNHNAETYMLVGDALGRAMVELQGSVTPPGNTFAEWIAGYPSVPAGLAGFHQDADGDGIDNGAENFFGTHPGVGSSGLVAGTSSGNTFTFSHPQNASPATGVTGAYRWSKDLATFRSHGETDGDNTTVNFNAVTTAGVTTVTATVSGTATPKLFVDVKVIQN